MRLTEQQLRAIIQGVISEAPKKKPAKKKPTKKVAKKQTIDKDLPRRGGGRKVPRKADRRMAPPDEFEEMGSLDAPDVAGYLADHLKKAKNAMSDALDLIEQYPEHPTLARLEKKVRLAEGVVNGILVSISDDELGAW